MRKTINKCFKKLGFPESMIFYEDNVKLDYGLYDGLEITIPYKGKTEVRMFSLSERFKFKSDEKCIKFCLKVIKTHHKANKKVEKIRKEERKELKKFL